MSPVEITPVANKPRWRLGYCYECGDGYRGGKVPAEKWAAMHLKDRHPDAQTDNPHCGTPGCEGWTEPTESETA